MSPELKGTVRYDAAPSALDRGVLPMGHRGVRLIAFAEPRQDPTDSEPPLGHRDEHARDVVDPGGADTGCSERSSRIGNKPWPIVKPGDLTCERRSGQW